MPKDGSSIYLDGQDLRNHLEQQPDITKDPKAYEKAITAPLNALTKELGVRYSGNRDGIIAQSLLKAAADMKPPLSTDQIKQVAYITQQASELMQLRAGIGDGVHDVHNLLRGLNEIGTVPRVKQNQTVTELYSIDKDGNKVNPFPALRGVGRFDIKDQTLPAAQALQMYSPEQRAEYDKYLQSFKKDGLQLSHLKDFGGTMRDFYGRLANPIDPMAVALVEATKDKKLVNGLPANERPVEAVLNLDNGLREKYLAALDGPPAHPKRDAITEAWRTKGDPWLDIKSADAATIYGSGDPKTIQKTLGGNALTRVLDAPAGTKAGDIKPDTAKQAVPPIK